jgi:hypothetical protein
MSTIKIVKKGFFDKRKKRICFIKFENITAIDFPSEDYNTGRWEIDITYTHLNEERIYTLIENRAEVTTLHKNLLEAWMSYQTNSTSIEEQIEKLLSTIDIIPGGKEYEETKTRFENRIVDEKFELNF